MASCRSVVAMAVDPNGSECAQKRRAGSTHPRMQPGDLIAEGRLSA
jgi:hypothetical protein